MEWREVYNVGIEPIDGQHKRLLHMLSVTARKARNGHT